MGRVVVMMVKVVTIVNPLHVSLPVVVVQPNLAKEVSVVVMMKRPPEM
tara:strand:- start:1189 stop:1332 length:144 start_codon:yes stop_codon:yes gene_type:complete